MKEIRNNIQSIVSVLKITYLHITVCQKTTSEDTHGTRSYMYAHMTDKQSKLQAIKLPEHLLIFTVKAVMKQNTCNKAFTHPHKWTWMIPVLPNKTQQQNVHPQLPLWSVLSPRKWKENTQKHVNCKQIKGNWYYSTYKASVQCIKPYVWIHMIKTCIFKCNYFGGKNDKF